MVQIKKVSDALKKAVDEADSIMGRAFQEAATKVRSARAGENNGDGDPSYGHCLLCSCGGYVSPTGAGPHSMMCQRGGCGHTFSNHDVF
jgi:hypothetical protein